MNSIEWLQQELMKSIYFQRLINDLESKKTQIEPNVFLQAKEMEREQHGKTWDAALDAGQSRAWNVMRAYSDFDDYFAETYGSKGSETKQ